jgi:hypothetical protein
VAKKPPSDAVSIGKFDILATYAYAKALLDGLNDDEAKYRSMVAAIIGARIRVRSARNTTRSSKPSPHQRTAIVGFDRGRKEVTDWPIRSRWKKLLKESDPS